MAAGVHSRKFHGISIFQWQTNSRDFLKVKPSKTRGVSVEEQSCRMPEVWCTLKKSLACTKSLLCDVHEPEAISNSIAKERTERDPSGCLRSKSNLRDIICGSKRHSEKPSPGSSSRSVATSEVLHSIIHEIEAQIKTDNSSVSHQGKTPIKPDTRNGYESICQDCGGVFKNPDAVESHHLSKHAVEELVQGDSSRKVIELICERNWAMSKPHHIEKVFKVRNSPKTLSLFEEHREMVKSKASKLEKEENPRYLVDGNELLRFHGTRIACPLAGDGSQILCDLDSCGVCQILRHGFNGVLICATSGRALESIAVNEEEEGLRRAIMVCRVIAGRIHGGGVEEDDEEANADSGLDSSGGETGRNRNPEEFHVVNGRAVLPCFVVTYKR